MADDPRIREAAVALAWQLDLPWFKKAALGRDMTPLAEVAVTAADQADPLRALLADEDRAVELFRQAVENRRTDEAIARAVLAALREATWL